MITEKCLLPSSGADSGSNGDYSKKICKKRKTQGGESSVGPHKHFRSEGNPLQSRDAKSEALPLHPPFNVTTDASSLQAPVTTNAGLPLTMSLPIITSTSPLSSANIQVGISGVHLRTILVGVNSQPHWAKLLTDEFHVWAEAWFKGIVPHFSRTFTKQTGLQFKMQNTCH